MHAMNSWDKKQWKKKYKLFSGYGFNKCARRKNRGSDKMDRDTATSLLHNSHEQFWAHAFIVTRGESLSDYLQKKISLKMACLLDIHAPPYLTTTWLPGREPPSEAGHLPSLYVRTSRSQGRT